MDSTEYIKKLTILYICSLVASVVSTFYFESSLPPLLQEYLAQPIVENLTSLDVGVFWALLAAVIVHFVSIYGLWAVKRWAKSTFLYTNIIMFALSLFIGPTVNDAVSSALGFLASLFAGAILALLYLMPSEFGSNEDTTKVKAFGLTSD